VAALAAAPPNIGRALESQKRLVAERPNDPAVFNDLGNLFLLAHQPGEAKQALDFYRQVLEAQPEHAWAHYQAGALYEAGGQTSRAVGEYARAFSLDPQLAFRGESADRRQQAGDPGDAASVPPRLRRAAGARGLRGRTPHRRPAGAATADD